ncbi:hypothetical protein, partial [Sulfitobacter pontiacus]|uniref:hypothetical protein n=1 Tax=Sulfitobacter pontiacus TaxID=60137 RepID=UPI001AD80843
ARCQISACHHVRRPLPDGVRKRVTHKILHSLANPTWHYENFAEVKLSAQTRHSPLVPMPLRSLSKAVVPRYRWVTP